MKIGYIGLGKLGLPCALAVSLKGHDVVGYDIDPDKMQKDSFPHLESGPNGEPSIEPMLRSSNLRFGTLEDVVRHSEIIIVAVQTPHEKEYEGVTRLPDNRVDFDYSHLISCMRELSTAIDALGEDKIVVVSSTVLPGTMRTKILPLVSDRLKLCYCPAFIAMGTTMRDFLHPEFILFGVHDTAAAEHAEAFYGSIVEAPFYRTSVENAELIKVAYNTFIGMKIVFANVLMEICHKSPGTDIDEVTNGLKLATKRIISPTYLSGGMGDGGGCHPRDNIALSWLARELDLSVDWFESVMVAREKQTEWLADLMQEIELPKVILGKAFKEGSNIATGSPSILLKNILEERGQEVLIYDPRIDGPPPSFEKSVFLIGTKHPEFENFSFPDGSVVIDPWRYLPERPGVKIIRVGVNER